MIPLVIILGLLLMAVIAIISVYNKLVTAKNRMQEAWSGIDVFLKKRHDLVPNLVAVVKGYAAHEKETFEAVIRCRSQAMYAREQEEQIRSETDLSKSLGQLMVVVEKYPDLKANQNFLELQMQLSAIEEELSLARRYYNGTVRENNIRIESFPSNIIAGMFGFKKGKFFEIDKSETNINFYNQ
ncbi:MAG: LemA family protein [Bacteroidetes bacterium]|nr:LemA family protein [Bacteroidota bacterium]